MLDSGFIYTGTPWMYWNAKFRLIIQATSRLSLKQQNTALKHSTPYEASVNQLMHISMLVTSTPHRHMDMFWNSCVICPTHTFYTITIQIVCIRSLNSEIHLSIQKCKHSYKWNKTLNHKRCFAAREIFQSKFDDWSVNTPFVLLLLLSSLDCRKL